MLKKARVKPLYKSKNRQNIQIYRTICILSVFSKPLEKLMYNRLLLFLKKHNILTSEQHGFTENKSTETASHSFIQSVQEALDKHLYAVGIFLDLSKAYDVIYHKRLLDKLDSYGIRGIVNKWFQSYLANRTQFVEISHIDKKRAYSMQISILTKDDYTWSTTGLSLGPPSFSDIY